jgi:transcriptional regulator with GAF, ATPase, and Fis domain
VLEEIAYAVQESVGFNVVLLSVLEGSPPYQHRVAAAGIPIVDFERMKKVQQPWSLVEQVLDDEFRISQSYYIPAERQALWRDRLDVYEGEAGNMAREPGRWHPHDALFVPLIGPGGDVQGLLSVDQPRDGRVPDQATVEALEIFAAQAALAVVNARLVEELERRAETLALFNEISRSATAKLELSAVLDTVVGVVTRLLQCDYGSVFLLDPESGRYVPRVVHGFVLDDISKPSFAPGEGLVGAVAESGMPLSIDDVRQERCPELVEGPHPGRGCSRHRPPGASRVLANRGGDTFSVGRPGGRGGGERPPVRRGAPVFIGIGTARRGAHPGIGRGARGTDSGA